MTFPITLTGIFVGILGWFLWLRGVEDYSRLLDYCRQQISEKHDAIEVAEQWRREAWKLRLSIESVPACETCGCPSEVTVSGTAVIGGGIYLCDDCYHEGLSFMESEHE